MGHGANLRGKFGEIEGERPLVCLGHPMGKPKDLDTLVVPEGQQLTSIPDRPERYFIE